MIATYNMEYAAMAVKVEGDYVAVIRPPLWRAIGFPGIEFDPEEGLTQQQFKEECDINNIMKRYAATGVITHLNMAVPEYGDFSSPIDFQTGLNVVRDSQALFDALPAAIRDRFANDPQKLLEFMSDPENLDEAISLGIVKGPDPIAEPMRVQVVDPASGEAPKGSTDSSPPQPKAP